MASFWINIGYRRKSLLRSLTRKCFNIIDTGMFKIGVIRKAQNKRRYLYSVHSSNYQFIRRRIEYEKNTQNINSSLEGSIKSRNKAKLEERLEKSESAIDKSFVENIAGYIAKHGMRDDTMALDMDSRTNTVYPLYSGNLRNKEDHGAIYTFSTSLIVNNKYIDVFGKQMQHT